MSHMPPLSVGEGYAWAASAATANAPRGPAMAPRPGRTA